MKTNEELLWDVEIRKQEKLLYVKVEFTIIDPL